MASVALDERRLKTLSVFGDVNKLVDEAIDDYLTKKIKDRVKTARDKVTEFESKYGASYAVFSERAPDNRLRIRILSSTFRSAYPIGTLTTSRNWN